MTVPPKCAVPEFERRWLVANMSSVPGPLGDARLIEDRYIAGTRLRLRRVTDAQGGVTTKLGKKYPAEAGGFEWIVNVYLDAAEYALLVGLPARRSLKRRYSMESGSLDVYVQPQADLWIFEAERATEAQIRAYQPPQFVGREITGDPHLTGFAIASSGSPAALLQRDS
jgi:CYTH domain-containing protein